mmetsp:Transcript_2171/g.3611  ORF Transcript_2171/g.3611 Transcript_2171/m.3611 type:complete len:558 (+) Transcript_2171:274-1947(+)
MSQAAVRWTSQVSKATRGLQSRSSMSLKARRLSMASTRCGDASQATGHCLQSSRHFHSCHVLKNSSHRLEKNVASQGFRASPWGWLMAGWIGVPLLGCAVYIDTFGRVFSSPGDTLKDSLATKLASVREGRNISPPVRIRRIEGDSMVTLSFTVASSPFRTLSILFEGIEGLKRETSSVPEADLVFSKEDRSFQLQFVAGELCVSKPNGDFSEEELDTFVEAYRVGGFPGRDTALPSSNIDLERELLRSFGMGAQQMHTGQQPPSNPEDGPVEKLEGLGATIYQPDPQNDIDWSSLAGYEDVKRDVEDTVLLGLKHPEEFDEVTRKTRVRFESNRPRALLFEGPPGTGKTTTARIIANITSVPMVYVPIEALMSKWYGESESKLAEVLKLCDELGSAIVFLDEVDSLATSRDSGGSMHEATRRLLSVLLRSLDGFQENSQRSVIIAATNRKQDLDAALLSRFDLTIGFPLPSEEARAAIFAQYAKHLGNSDHQKLAKLTANMSGRDIKDICKYAERRWVSEALRIRSSQPEKDAVEIGPPNIETYEIATKVRQKQNI